MITHQYYDCLRRLLGAGDLTKQAAFIGFGTSDATATPDDTELQNMVVTPITGVTYDADGHRLVKLHFELARTDGVGMSIREIGVLTADLTLIARKTRDPILKTADMRISEFYEIEV